MASKVNSLASYFGCNKKILYCLAIFVFLFISIILLTCNEFTAFRAIIDNTSKFIDCIILFYVNLVELFSGAIVLCLENTIKFSNWFIPLFQENFVKIFNWSMSTYQNNYKEIMFLYEISVKFITFHLYVFISSVIEYYFYYDYSICFSEYKLTIDNIFNPIALNMEGSTEHVEVSINTSDPEQSASSNGGDSSNDGDDESNDQYEIPDEYWNWKEDSSSDADANSNADDSKITTLDKGKGVDKDISPLPSENPNYCLHSEDDISALDANRKQIEAQQLDYWKSQMSQHSDMQRGQAQSLASNSVSDVSVSASQSQLDSISDEELEKYRTNTINSEDDELTKKEKLRLQELDQQLKQEKIERDKQEAATKALDNHDPWEGSSKAGEKRALQHNDQQETYSTTKRRR